MTGEPVIERAMDWSAITLPPGLQRLRSMPGVHRRGSKGIIFGPPKTGKSYWLAHLPKPRLLLDFGEGGIQPYLDEDDLCLVVENNADCVKVMDFVRENSGKLAAVGLDPITEAWADWLDGWTEELDHEIKGGDWRKVKPPWKKMMRMLMRAPFHTWFAAHHKDLEYSQVQEVPGAKPTLQIAPQDTAAVEKKLPYTVDMFLRTDTVNDNMNRPTSKHTIRFWGGRIPHALVGELVIGRTWEFDATKRPNPWEIVMEPLLDKWNMKAVDYIGISNPAGFEKVRKEIEEEGSDYVLGKIVRYYQACPAKTLPEYEKWWEDHIAEHVPELVGDGRSTYKGMHAQMKDRLGKGGTKA